MSDDRMIDPRTYDKKLFARVRDASNSVDRIFGKKNEREDLRGISEVDRYTHLLMEALAAQGIALRNIADGE